MINNTIKSDQEKLEAQEVDDAVAEFLKKGGTVTKCEAGARTENLYVGQWGRPRGKTKAVKKVNTK